MMPGSGPPNAEVMIIGEAPGENEVYAGKPFVGAAGYELDRIMAEAGYPRSQCFVTNVCRVRPIKNQIDRFFRRTKTKPNGDKWPGDWAPWRGGWATKEVRDGDELLQREIELVNPKLIIAVGNLALLATTGEWGIGSWRGSTLARGTRLVVPTYHPAAVLREWSLRTYVLHDLRRAFEAKANGVVVPNYRFVIRPNFTTAATELTLLLDRLAEGPLLISCDIETRAGHIACIGFAWSRLDAFCIPLMCVERPEGYWSAEEEFALWKLMRAVLMHPNARIVGQNFIYDTQYLWRWGKCIPRLALDTMLAYHVCFPGMDKDLATLSSLFCDYHVYWKDDGKEWSKGMGEDQLWSYNCEDTVRTYEIAEKLTDLVMSLGFVEQCIFQHRMWHRALATMIRGVAINAQEKRKLSLTLLEEATTRESWLTSILGHELNEGSSKQMQGFFYHDLKLPVQRNRKTGNPSLDDESLGKLCLREPIIRPIVRVIRELRSLGVFRSTFVESRMGFDNRMRCSYNVGGTETFRFSSSKDAFGSGLNLQNVPKGGESDPDEDNPLILPNIRQLFVPDPGYELFDLDLDQADLQIVAEEADEPELRAIVASGAKVYVEIGKEFYHDPSFSKYHPRYTTFKSLIHGTHYLGTARGLAQRLGLSVHETERVQSWYLGRCKRIAKWQDDLKAKVASERSVTNAFGYRRYYFDRVEGTLFNQAAAWIPQSTIGILINKIWDSLVEHEPGIHILLQVHDSLVGQYPAARAEYYRAIIRELSRVPIPYPRPLIIGTGMKTSQRSWGECG